MSTLPSSTTAPTLAMQFNCPQWCVITHDAAPDADSVITHQAEPQAYGIAFYRIDHPALGHIGEPHVYVSVDEELQTLEEASELACAILDAFRRMTGADQ